MTYSSAKSVDLPTAADVVSGLPEVPTTAELIPQVSALRYRSSFVHSNVVRLDRAVFAMGLAERQAHWSRSNSQTLLRRLFDLGMSWSSISRLIGVSVPAIRKWRQGESTTPSNRAKLASAAALLDLLDEQFMIEDPAAWLEVPLADTQLTLLDVASSGRIDLVIDYAGTKIRSAAELLDEFDPQWHDAVQSSFETFVAPDGQLAIRRRGL